MTPSIFHYVNALYYATQFNHALRFKKRVGFWPNVAIPSHFNERILWRKFVDNNPMFVDFCDKIATKEYFASRCPGIKLPKTLWVGKRAEDIPDEFWQQQVVIKVNCASRQNVFLRGQTVDRATEIQKLNAWMQSRPFGERYGESAYAKVDRLIMVEEYYGGDDETSMIDIKPNACNGVVANVRIIAWTPHLSHLGIHRQGCVLAADGSRIESRNKVFPSDEKQLPKSFCPPPSFFTAVEMAKQASVGVDYARVDFLCGTNDVYGGEMTIYPGAGYDMWSPSIISDQIEAIWDLRVSWFLLTPQSGWKARYAQALHQLLDQRAGGMINNENRR